LHLQTEPQPTSDVSQVCRSPTESPQYSPAPELPASQIHSGNPRPTHAGLFTCDVDGCTSKTFKRRGDLTRHSKTHGSQRRHDCPALHCDRTGKRGFTRRDKLTDHILAGHDDDTMFACPTCHKSLSRDLFSIHKWFQFWGHQYYRTCPLPRCSFKLNVSDFSKFAMDDLQVHLLEHDLKHRLSFANLLEQRGYDARTCKVVCPICPTNSLFSDCEEVSHHFMQTHFHRSACGWHADASCGTDCYGRTVFDCWWKCTSIPNEVRQHRRTILRIWPKS
jgi:hypothetical protein